MKLLRNPVVVGTLGVLAVAMILYNTRPMWQRKGQRPAASNSETSAPTPPPATQAVAITPYLEAPTQKTNRILPETNIDLTQVRWKLNGSPRRDPFQVTPATITNLFRAYPPAAELLRLTGVWRQTGSSLAVVNGRILGVGDHIQMFTIESIDGDSVWLEGPAGREQIEFNPINSGPISTNLNVKVPQSEGTAMK